MAQKITVTMDRLSATLAEIFLTAARKNHAYIVDELGKVGQAAQGYITRETYLASGLKVRSGALVQENYPIPLEKRGDMMVTGIRNKMHYAAAHELGAVTRPHDIRPRNKKALYWEGAAHPVKVVHHPGSRIPARPFIQPALALAIADFEARIMGEGGIGL